MPKRTVHLALSSEAEPAPPGHQALQNETEAVFWSTSFPAQHPEIAGTIVFECIRDIPMALDHHISRSGVS